MDSNEQQQAGAGAQGGFGGFGFNPFGEAFWSQFSGGAKGGSGGAQGQAGQGNIDDLFKEFEQFFSMGGDKQGTGSSARGSSNAGKAKGKDVNVWLLMIHLIRHISQRFNFANL